MRTNKNYFIICLFLCTLVSCVSTNQSQEDLQNNFNGNNNQLQENENNFSNNDDDIFNEENENINENENSVLNQQEEMLSDNNKNNEKKFNNNSKNPNNPNNINKWQFSQSSPNKNNPWENRLNFLLQQSQQSMQSQADKQMESLSSNKMKGSRKNLQALIPWSTLWWIGYNYQENKALVTIELITRGTPEFDLLKEYNQLGEYQLIVRYYRTKLRKKLRRDIDAREFASPISYIKSRSNENSIDVIITMREKVRSKLYSSKGNILLTFEIPISYYGNSAIGQSPIEKAEEVTKVSLIPVILQGSDKPINYAHLYQESFDNVPFNRGQELDLMKDVAPNYPDKIAAPVIEIKKNKPDSDDSTEQENNSQFNNFNNNNADNNNQNERIVNNFDVNELEANEDSDNDTSENQGNMDNGNEWDNSNQSPLNENGNENFEQLENENDFSSLTPHIFLAAVAAETLDADLEDNNNFSNLNEYNNFSNSDTNNTSSAGANNNQAQMNEQNNGENPDFTDDEQFDNDDEYFEEEFDNDDEYFEEEGENLGNNINMGELPAEEQVGTDTEQPVETSYYQPVSIDFRNANLREVIRTLTKEDAVNFIIPDRIANKKIFLTLKDVPWDRALKAVLDTYSLGMIKLDGDIIRIDTLTQIKQDKENVEKIKENTERLIPTKVLVNRLSYAKAEEVAKLIKSMITSSTDRAQDPRIKVESDSRTNSVIVEAVPTTLEKVKALIQRVDLRTPQVKIEIRIIEILKTVDKFLGINWAAPFRLNQGRGLGFGNLVFPNNIVSSFSVDTGAANRPGVAFDTRIGSVNNLMELDLRLRMSELSNRTRTLQNTSVIVLDNKKANIEAGQEDRIITPGGNGGTGSTEPIEYKLKLEVTPHITAEGSVQMEIYVVNAEPREVAAGNQVAASMTTRSTNTNLLRKNGETAVIGGLYTTSSRQNIQGFPILSKIPILGLFFRSKGFSESKREIIIMVTPTIVDRIIESEEAEDYEDDYENQSNFDEYNYIENDPYEQNDNISKNNNENFQDAKENNFNLLPENSQQFNEQQFNPLSQQGGDE